MCGEREKKEKSDDRVRLIWPRARLELSGECLRVVNLVLPPLLLLSSLHSSSIEFQLVQSRQFLFFFVFLREAAEALGAAAGGHLIMDSRLFFIRIHADFTKNCGEKEKDGEPFFQLIRIFPISFESKGRLGGLSSLLSARGLAIRTHPKQVFFLGCALSIALSLFFALRQNRPFSVKKK